ncbi:MAG: DNA mismatch repair endonuclease MutL [Oscillospiraceae bacterium]|nr:DNA mismatch repair endonuclease MutL [Oscillospiraceae bacterium]
MPKIHQLSTHVADLIAAGEVVERPGSVVKELTENAIDAGATSLTVEIQNGGITFIRVTDNGCGMSPEDAETAFLRHATSKIRSADDLAAIHTLGFRGEALAAICSVSRIDLMTRECGADAGVSLHLDAGVVTEREPAGCPDGTTVIVRNLFYNTPARMKFLKRDTAEGANVFAVVQRQALAHPEVAFRFLRDGEEAMSTPGDGKLLSAIYAILGRQTAMEMIPVDNTWENVHVTGFVTKPTATRGSHAYEHFFVNGRYIKSKSLISAVEDAYKNQIMVGRFPACVLCIAVQPEAVDVNVHPAKTEVKFLAERAVFDTVHYGVLAVLNQAPRPEAALHVAPIGAPQRKADFYKTMDAADFRSFAETVAAVPKAALPQGALGAVFPKAQTGFTTAVPAASESRPPEVASPIAAPRPSAPVAPVIPLPTQKATPPAPLPDEPPVQEALPMQQIAFHVIGEMLNTYIIAEQGDEVFLIDKHAAHERVLFEKLKAQKHTIMSQLLITPISANFDREDAALLLQNAALLRDYGYELEDFGGGSVLIRQVPSDIDADDAEDSLAAMAELFRANRHPDPMALRDNVLHTIACKAAIKGGWHTSPVEREALVREVLLRDDIKYCPHGRPVCIVLTRRELEKQFKRV